MGKIQVRISAAEVRDLLSLRGEALSRALSEPGTLVRYRAAERVLATVSKVGGRHYSAHAPKVKELEKNGKLQMAVELLLRLLDAIDEEASLTGADGFTPPWYYERLAINYKKLKQPDAEISTLRRYVGLQNRNGKPVDAKLADRLEKAVAKQSTKI